MLHREIIAVCSQIHTMCGQNAEMSNIKPLGSERLNLVSTTWSAGKSVPTSTTATWPVMYCQSKLTALPICGSQRPYALVGERARNERLQPMDLQHIQFELCTYCTQWALKGSKYGKMRAWVKCVGRKVPVTFWNVFSLSPLHQTWKFRPVTAEHVRPCGYHTFFV